jgi:hypothetical protein
MEALSRMKVGFFSKENIAWTTYKRARHTWWDPRADRLALEVLYPCFWHWPHPRYDRGLARHLEEHRTGLGKLVADRISMNDAQLQASNSKSPFKP